MTLAARCPRCETVFRITGTQLAAAEGWARCGVCNHLFDASQQLVGVPELNQPARQAEGTPGDLAPDFALQPLPDIDLELPDLGPLQSGAPMPDPAPTATSPAAPAEPDPQPPFHEPETDARGRIEPAFAPALEPALEPALGPAPESALRPAVDPAQEAVPVPATWVEPQAPAASEPPIGEVGAPPAAASDLRGAMAAAPGAAATDGPAAAAAAAAVTGAAGAGAVSRVQRGSAGRAAALVLLVALLLAQLAYGLRGHIAQTWPELRAPIVEACARLGCTLPALRLLPALRVDGSSLSYDDDTRTHRLRLLITSRSDMPVHTPSVDLSVLDAQGQVLARRTLLPEDFDRPVAEVPAGGEAEVIVTLDLSTLTPGSVASFKADLYYP